MNVSKIVIACFSFLLFMQSNAVLSDTVKPYFVIVIPSYNNSQWYQKNISSALNQNYDNYEVVYINNCSTDDTGRLVQEFIDQNSSGVKVTIINNPQRCGALYNIYHAAHAVPDDAIIVLLDGDDWLFDKNVLSKLSRVYADQNVWMTYGSYARSTNGSRGIARVIPDEVVKNNTYRECRYVFSHLRTFYAWLFKKIKKEDLLYENEFFSMTWDQAIIFPMLEMAGGRYQFISDSLYVYNIGNPINDHKVDRALQVKLEKVIRARKRYECLNSANV